MLEMLLVLVYGSASQWCKTFLLYKSICLIAGVIIVCVISASVILFWFCCFDGELRKIVKSGGWKKYKTICSVCRRFVYTETLYPSIYHSLIS